MFPIGDRCGGGNPKLSCMSALPFGYCAVMATVYDIQEAIYSGCLHVVISRAIHCPVEGTIVIMQRS